MARSDITQGSLPELDLTGHDDIEEFEGMFEGWETDDLGSPRENRPSRNAHFFSDERDHTVAQRLFYADEDTEGIEAPARAALRQRLKFRSPRQVVRAAAAVPRRPSLAKVDGAAPAAASDRVASDGAAGEEADSGGEAEEVEEEEEEDASSVRSDLSMAVSSWTTGSDRERPRSRSAASAARRV
mmetsp:Transcript_39470/g.109648  ORF Transcript_39470/g.109648 Transcript_39470/m.109648 type:complete len:185 (-) Transcript_39470:128-682(-)